MSERTMKHEQLRRLMERERERREKERPITAAPPPTEYHGAVSLGEGRVRAFEPYEGDD